MAQIKKTIKRLFKKPNWHNLRKLKPISKVFGFDRGTPIDRIYIEDFLQKNKELIRGIVCEIGEDTYAKKIGTNIEKIEVFKYINENRENKRKEGLFGDLTNISTLPKEGIDCFILTQTLNFIYDFKKAIEGVYYMLKPGGVVLATVAGLSQISRYDMDRWGDYWRFTDLSIKIAFEEVFGSGNFEVDTYGNVLTATAFLQGIAAEELTREELFYKDKDYQIIITVKGIKR